MAGKSPATVAPPDRVILQLNNRNSTAQPPSLTRVLIPGSETLMPNALPVYFRWLSHRRSPDDVKVRFLGKGEEVIFNWSKTSASRSVKIISGIFLFSFFQTRLLLPARNGRPEQTCSKGRAARQEKLRPQHKCVFLDSFYGVISWLLFRLIDVTDLLRRVRRCDLYLLALASLTILLRKPTITTTDVSGGDFLPTRQCPYCGQPVHGSLAECPHCHETIPELRADAPAPRRSEAGRRIIRRGLLCMLLAAVIHYFAGGYSAMQLPFPIQPAVTVYLAPLLFLAGLGLTLYGLLFAP